MVHRTRTTPSTETEPPKSRPDVFLFRSAGQRGDQAIHTISTDWAPVVCQSKWDQPNLPHGVMGGSSSKFPAFRAQLPSMAGKVVVITGTTSGTGYVAAQTLAQQGARVIMLNRTSKRSEAALSNLQAAVPDGTFTQIACDLMDFSSVRGAAADVLSATGDEGVDVLLLNAGIMAMPDKATVDGYDVQMQTNHLSHFLLAQKLLPALNTAAQKRGDARVVSHSSIAYKSPQAPVLKEMYGPNGGNLGGDGAGIMMNGPRWQRYQQSKLANLVFTLALQDRLTAANSNVRALVAHPGLSKTNLQVTTGDHGGMASEGGWLMYLSQTAEEGTMGILRCCTDPQAVPGGFYGPNHMLQLSGLPELITIPAWVNSVDNKDTLWRASVKAVGCDFDI